MGRVNVRLSTVLDGRLVKENTQFEAASIADLLGILAQKYGDSFRREIFDGHGVMNYYIVLHNGSVIDREKPEDVVLADGDTVHIFPPVSGG
jgi:MoaD family protein